MVREGEKRDIVAVVIIFTWLKAGVWNILNNINSMLNK